MSRTAHHTPYRRANRRPFVDPGHTHRDVPGRRGRTMCPECELPQAVWVAHVEDGLRYSRDGHVASVRRRVVKYSIARSMGRRDIGHYARFQEATARRTLRDWATDAVKAANGGADADDFDPPVPRHRHTAVWDAF